MMLQTLSGLDDGDRTLSSSDARSLTDKIRAGLEGMYQLVIEAYHGRVWVSLGYGSWDEYIRREFGNLPLRPPLEDREEVIQSLRHSGLSNRAIAAVTDLGETSVRRSLARSGAPNGAPERQKSRVIGQDGRGYRSVENSPERAVRVQQLREKGKSIRDIASETGLSVGSVHADLHKGTGPGQEDLDAPAEGFGIKVLDTNQRELRQRKHVEKILKEFHGTDTATLQKAMYLAEKISGFVSPVTAVLDMKHEAYFDVSKDLAAAIRQFSHVAKILANAQADFQNRQVLIAIVEDLKSAGDDLSAAISRMESKKS